MTVLENRKLLIEIKERGMSRCVCTSYLSQVALSNKLSVS